MTKASVTMPCETHLLGKLKIPMAVYIFPAKGIDSILCYPACPVDATRWLSLLSVSAPVVEKGTLLQVYVTTGLFKIEIFLGNL